MRLGASLRRFARPVILVGMLSGGLVAASAGQAEALLQMRSPGPVAATMDRLQQQVTAAGFFVAAWADHGRGAADVG